MENKYFKYGELQDQKITEDLLKAAENYENGEIIEVRDMLEDILSAIKEWEYDYYI